MKTQVKTMPSFKSDADAEQFVATSDLSQYDLAAFAPMRFEMEAKSAALNMRLPEKLLHALKLKARAQKIPYTRYVRFLLERDVAVPTAATTTSMFG
jgi:predicted DNA binding CopG/RHH family protein